MNKNEGDQRSISTMGDQSVEESKEQRDKCIEVITEKMWAVLSRDPLDVAKLRQLLLARADVNRLNSTGWTPFVHCCNHGYEDAIALCCNVPR